VVANRHDGRDVFALLNFDRAPVRIAADGVSCGIPHGASKRYREALLLSGQTAGVALEFNRRNQTRLRLPARCR